MIVFGDKNYQTFNNFTHLSLNWRDTEAFQNPSNDKFTQIRKRYESIIEKDKSPAKGSDMTEEGVLMAHKTDKVIAINDYLHWLKYSYKIDLKYENKDPADNPVRIPNGELSHEELCSGKPLQTYLKKK